MIFFGWSLAPRILSATTDIETHLMVTVIFSHLYNNNLARELGVKKKKKKSQQ